MLTVRGRCRANDEKVHTDSRSKLITALIYLNDGWSGGGGQLRLLRSNNIDDVIAEVPPYAGTLICFRNRENAWLGHTSYEGPCRALQLNWVVDDAAVRKFERRHGLSARLKGFSRSFLATRKITTSKLFFQTSRRPMNNSFGGLGPSMLEYIDAQHCCLLS